MKSRLDSITAVLLGVAVTYIVYGYQFGTSNHTAYLLSALRAANPTLLSNDWFTTQTLQYHAAFGWFTVALVKLHFLETGFWISYLAIVALFHVAWWRIVRTFNGSSQAYLLSVLIYHFSAGGTGLGMYQFFQDSSFLPSNVANVAMLWAIYLRITRRWIPSAICFGIAGVFHLNHALVAVGLWSVLTVLDLGNLKNVRYALATALVLIPCLANAAVVAQIKLAHGAGMPLSEFVDLYVRLRHPHHYDLRSWPIALWINVIWTIPFAWIWAKRQLPDAPSFALRESLHIYGLLMGLLLLAIVGAGIWYLNESLIQMSLYRFTIYLQLFAAIAAAIELTQPRVGDRAWYVASGAGLLLPVVLLYFFRRPIVLERQHALIALGAICAIVLGTRKNPPALSLLFALTLFGAIIIRPACSGIIRWSQHDDADYLNLCDWARDHTPVGAVFLVPPNETEMRLRGQRAVVVNYKCIPQLSSEIPQWRDRLQDVLDLPTLLSLPRGFKATTDAIGERYASLTGSQLRKSAEKYGARYIVAPHRLPDLPDAAIIYSPSPGQYLVYDLARD